MITPGFHPVKGGTETVVRDLSIAVKELGVDVDVMTFNMNMKWRTKWNGETSYVDGIKVYRIPALNWLPKFHSPRLNLQINVIPGRFTQIFKDYDLLHFHEAEFSFPLFSTLVNKPKVLHLHGIFYDYFKRYGLSRFLLKHVASNFISITMELKSILERFGIPRERILYLPNFVNTDVFCPQGEKEDNLLLFVGRIDSRKGLHILLQALSYVHIPVHLVIIGPLRLGSYGKIILKMIERQNQKTQHRIEYLGVLESQQELISWYRRASVFVAPSIYEPFGVVLLEALACTTPVIGTKCGGIPEIVRENIDGRLVPPNDPRKLAVAIQYFLENKDQATRMGFEGRQRVLSNFSLEKTAKKLHSTYRNIL
jgi:starch synthase